MSSPAARQLDLRSLCAGMPGLTSEIGGGLAQAAAVCLEHNAHHQGVEMEVAGSMSARFLVAWEPATDQVRRAHFDLQDATENGACGVAIALSRDLLGKEVVEKAYKGKGKGRGLGFDYWLGDAGQSPEDLVFMRDLRLEVSGILKGSPSDVRQRLRSKVDQVSRYSESIPGIAVVVAFSQPQTLVGQP